MTPEQEVGSKMGGIYPQVRIGGAHTGPIASSKASLKIDNQQLKGMQTELKGIKKLVDEISKGFKSWNIPGRSGPMKAQNGQDLPAPPTTGNGTRDLDVGGVYNRNQMGAFAKFAAIQAGASMVGAIDQRIDRGANYALTADRYNVIMQQQYGLTQNQVMNQMRKPLANYRMGPDGINAMMGFQQQTGYAATRQLTKSLSGIRAITGYAKTGQDVVNDQMSIMDPMVANRMLYMTGVNAYTFNGGLNDPMKMRQQLVQSMGLTNAAVLKGAKGPGSITRARMTDAGISTEMQDEILTYAQENLTFQKKGGKGMYDPSKKRDRKLMGIEDNFATQVEETDRLRQSREESYSRAQLGNLSSMEKNTQQMVKLLESIDKSFQDVMGLRTRTRGTQRAIGSFLQIAGGAAAFIPGAQAAALPLMAGGSLLAGGVGDGSGTGTSGTGANTKSSSAGDSSISVPYGYNGKRVPLDQLRSMEQFRSLNPKLQERLLSMFRANPNIGIGGGGRSTEQQRQLFLSRYRKTSKKTDIFWEGSYWEHVSGAPAAPPGRSMHEIGLAADLVGDMDWIKKNAGKFGLRSFFDVNNEPWHVQPSELPGSRREYEKSGAPWGGGGSYSGDTTGNAVNDKVNPDASEKAAGVGSGMTFSNLRDFSGMSISDILANMEADSGSLLGTGGPNRSGTKSKSTSAAPVTDGNEKGAALAARLAYDVGFRGEDLFKMVAIAGRESGWNPSNKNPNTSDHGMWQVNWSANGKTMMRELGISGPADLFDPKMNARAARILWERGGWRPWKASDHSSIPGPMHGKPGWDPNGNEMWHTEKFQAEARAAATAVEKSGDPYPGGGGGGNGFSGVFSSSPNFNITVAPNINFVGMPQSNDLKKIATEVVGLIEQEVRTLEMRGA